MSNKRVNPFKLKLHLIECEADEKDKKIADLEAKLAEKEKEIKTLQHYNDRLAQGIYHSYGEHFILKTKKDKISFAVEQLTQAKDYIKNSLENMWNGNAEMTCKDRNIIDGIYNKIDNQITDLKGNEDE